jgi:polyisoprenoid-binding protein YceI
MKIIFKSVNTILFLIVLAGFANAAPGEWNIDKVHSNIYFDIRHIFSTVRGKFDDFSGKILIDTEKPEASSVNFEVKVKSVNTFIGQRDTHLRSGDFFDVGKYPLMKFRSTSVKHVEGSKYLMTGLFTIKDVTREIEIPFTYLGVKDNPSNSGELVAGFDAAFNINRLDYHVGTGKYYDMGLVDKDVKVLITLELLKKK